MKTLKGRRSSTAPTKAAMSVARRSKGWKPSHLSDTAMFCPVCHAILELPDDHDVMQCPVCSFQLGSEGYGSQEHVTLVKFQHTQHHVSVPIESENKQRATVKEKCPACNHDTMEFYTMQLRSADEGQTIFYTCVKCGHTFSQNA